MGHLYWPQVWSFHTSPLRRGFHLSVRCYYLEITFPTRGEILNNGWIWLININNLTYLAWHSCFYWQLKYRYSKPYLKTFYYWMIVEEWYNSSDTREPYITPRATGPRGDIGRGLIRHVIQILTCNVHYIIYFNHAFDNTCILLKFWKILISYEFF